MNNEFRIILDNIEKSLNAALPQSCSSDASWKLASFGNLPEGTKDQYIDKFAESGSGFVAIVQDDSHKYLLNIFNGSNPSTGTIDIIDKL